MQLRQHRQACSSRKGVMILVGTLGTYLDPIQVRELLLRHAAEWNATHQGTEEELE